MNENITNRELIDKIYDLAGEQLRKEIEDWSNWKEWLDCVNNLDEKKRMVYMIGVLHQQVFNGGFIQYFDNGYGIFAYETLKFLKIINALESAKLFENALSLVNEKNLPENQFQAFIANSIVDDKHGDELDKLDDQYYTLESEDLEHILGNYLRRNHNN